SMRENQRYFSVLDKNGKLTNRFITLANVQPTDDGKTIIYGNEKVLRARLSDARFFWDQDLKQKLESYAPRLEQIRFHEKLGMMSEKAKRLEFLAGTIAGLIGADVKAAERAGKLAKADLVTGMVREFPELQGIMGGYYAARSGEGETVAAAISTHYSPLGPNDKCPTAPVSVALALADKLDTIVGFFSIGEKPTGSKDPFALRRAALGVIRLLLENKIALELSDLLKASADLYGVKVPDDLESFILDRFKVMMKGEGHPHNIIEAVSGTSLLDMKTRIVQLGAFLETDKGQDFVAAAKRAINILETEEKKEKLSLKDQVSELSLVAPEEKDLYSALVSISPKFDSHIKKGEYEGAMMCLADVRDKVDLFFDKVVVNDNNPDIRANRLAMLSKIRLFVGRIADFSRL
ncbi:MAG TPA: glycine--tRNA ligase subunit beta, partial [Alphaproteobacteria bacterium]|nr:glycine--tRNA ligase subunit beta [Alphaproteobacteria bacterium]